MRSPRPAYTLTSPTTGTITHVHCATCGYLPADQFHPSVVRLRQRSCRSCRNRANRRRRTGSEAARILCNFRQRIRKTAPALSRCWEVADVQALLEQQKHRCAVTGQSRCKLTLVPRSGGGGGGWTSTLRPATAMLVSETVARAAAHGRRIVPPRGS